MKKYKHIFFDMDGTITRAKSLITPEMHEVLESLIDSGRDMIIVSGQTQENIAKQTQLQTYYLCQNGNHALNTRTKEEYWKHILSPESRVEIEGHVQAIPRDWEVRDENDLLEDRGSQISYSLLGHHEDIVKKEAFDPDCSRREKILIEYPLVSNSVEVKIGGTTTLDYFEKGMHKGHNVSEFITLSGWESDECVYIGDMLSPGGNDETVVGVIDTKSVATLAETLAYVKSLLTSPLI